MGTRDTFLGRGAFLFLGLLLVIPAVALAAILPRWGDLPGATRSVNVLWAPPESVSGPEEFPATLNLTVGQRPSLTAPSWSGVVTWAAQPGTRVVTGTSLLAINGIERVACASDAPLFRPLKLGDSGTDVVTLRRCLAGILSKHSRPQGLSRVVDARMAGAIDAAARKLGAPANGVFEPSWVIWTSTSGWALQDLAAPVGALAPTAGTKVGEGNPPLKGAKVTVINDDGSVLLQGTARGAKMVFRAAGLDVALGTGGRLDLPQLTSKLAAILRNSTGNGAGGQEGNAPSGSAADSASPPSSQPSVSGVVVISGPPRLQVPISAAVGAASGVTCVFTKEQGGIRARVVQVRPSGRGQVVAQGLPAGALVAVNPSDLSNRPKCVR